MGFISVAKARQGIFFVSEFAWTTIAVSLALFCVKRYGLEGAGVAFFGSYVFHAILTYPIARYLSGFRWSEENQRTAVKFVLVIGIVFGGFYVLTPLWAAGFGAIAAVGSAIYSIRTLVTLISLEQIPRPLRTLIVGLGFAPSGPDTVG
jgi:PST family polysaccharide transporter